MYTGLEHWKKKMFESNKNIIESIKRKHCGLPLEYVVVLTTPVIAEDSLRRVWRISWHIDSITYFIQYEKSLHRWIFVFYVSNIHIIASTGLNNSWIIYIEEGKFRFINTIPFVHQTISCVVVLITLAIVSKSCRIDPLTFSKNVDVSTAYKIAWFIKNIQWIAHVIET